MKMKKVLNKLDLSVHYFFMFFNNTILCLLAFISTLCLFFFINIIVEFKIVNKYTIIGLAITGIYTISAFIEIMLRDINKRVPAVCDPIHCFPVCLHCIYFKYIKDENNTKNGYCSIRCKQTVEEDGCSMFHCSCNIALPQVISNFIYFKLGKGRRRKK